MTPAFPSPSYTRTQSVCLILASPYPCRICTIARRHFVVIVPLQTTLYKVALFRFVAKLDLLCRWIHPLEYSYNCVIGVGLQSRTIKDIKYDRDGLRNFGTKPSSDSGPDNLKELKKRCPKFFPRVFNVANFFWEFFETYTTLLSNF